MNHPRTQQNIHRLLVVLLVLILMLPTIPRAKAEDISGNCGKDAAWTLNAGVLTVSGSGVIEDYSEMNRAPWYKYRQTISRIVVSDGITHIGSYAFADMTLITSAQLPDSAKEIGSQAFYNCNSLEIIDIGKGVSEIGSSAFNRCWSLKAIWLPGSLQTIREMAFYRCESLRHITVPASVSTMEPRVFAYASGLQSATILANIGQLPYWTFYGCNNLRSVSLSSGITDIGVSAFENCNTLTDVKYGGSGTAAEAIEQYFQAQVPTLENFTAKQILINEQNKITGTVTQEQNGATVVVEQTHVVGSNSVVDTDIVRSENDTTIKIEAVVNNDSGWNDVEQQLDAAIRNNEEAQKAQLNVYLKSNGIIAGEDLGRFAGKNAKLSVHTVQGAVWHINCEDISLKEIQQSYDLSYTLTQLDTLTKAQKQVIGDALAYSLVFHSAIDFKVEVELPVGKPRNVATFFSMEKKNEYTSLQKSVVDNKGIAHFYLWKIQAEVEYLIGINVSSSNDSGAIIPDSMEGEYLPVEWIDKDKYIITDVKSSWGLTIGQLTWILLGVMVTAAVVVGVVMRILSKKRLQSEHFPQKAEDKNGKL